MKVFFDPERRRWKLITKIVAGILAVLSVITYLFFASILVNPKLPELGLRNFNLIQKKNVIPANKADDNQALVERMKKKLEKISKSNASVAKIPAVKADNNKVFAYYVEWDQNSFASLARNLGQIDYLLPAWLTINNADGTLRVVDPEKMKRTVGFLKNSASNIKILPVVSNYDDETNKWETRQLDAVLDDSVKSAKFIAELETFVKDNNLAGISLDFEDIPMDHRLKFIEFNKTLWETFKKDNLLVTSSVVFDDEGIDYAGLSQWNDYLILMAYDEHWSTGDAGPVASQDWFETTLARDEKLIPKEKLVVALANYGYDWPAAGGEGTTVTFQDALQTAKDSEGDIYMDDNSLNPTFDYYDDNNKLHHVFFLDAITAFNQRKFADGFNPAGYALWRLGAEDPDFWNIMRSDWAQSLEALKTVNNLYDIEYQGTGDMLKLKNPPQTGKRDLTLDSDVGLITDEDYSTLPLPYTISRYGNAGKNEVALTFDDGPDPNYTSQILDILKANSVKATFFIVGSAAEKNPDLLRRIVAEGNLLGNHTFTHPNIAFISEDQLRLELNITQRLFESIVGVKSLLFRPPYAEDIEPETLDQVIPLRKVSEMGYYTVGISIDPNDWRSPGVEKIVQDAVEKAQENKGGVVLLHDGGGDRNQTVQALPKLIKALQEKGFKIVPLSEMIGVDAAVLNPIANESDKVAVIADTFYFNVIGVLSGIVGALFFFSLWFGIIRLFLLLLLAVIGKIQAAKKQFDAKFLPKVTVIIAAYNEGKVIKQVLEENAQVEYANLEILVVDDGSTDDTLKVLRDNFGKNPLIKILTKPNEGKSIAINFALKQASGEVVVLIDADTLIDRKAIINLVRHFADPKVAAVAGNAKVGNRINIITNFQALEYVTNQNLERRALNLLNTIAVVPGAIGAWRRSVLNEMGGFNDHTLAEDNDMTVEILKAGYRVENEENAYAYTEAPANIMGLAKQRFRWTFGTLQVFWKNKKFIFHPKHKGLAFVGLPNTFFFQIFSPVVLPLIDLGVLAGIVFAFWKTYQHVDVDAVYQMEQYLFYYALFTFLDVFTVVVAFVLERKRDWRLLILLLPQRIFYRFFMNYICLKSLYSALRGSTVHWNKIERKGNVKSGGN